jgi:uroporphyrinogen III methyltransferase/synthase
MSSERSECAEADADRASPSIREGGSAGARGRVALVGAGPGDPGLITVKGLRLLRGADVVIYDNLADRAFLREARPDAELVYVGKRAGQHAMSQDEINRLLIAHGRAGKRVVRLKGGDPFVFGRGGEEAEALEAAGISWEEVPGITSAIAVPAYAGIPVTHRDYTAAFTVITGHEDPAKAASNLDWEKLATGAGTLVLLMGVGNLQAICAQLVLHGRPSTTPVAVVEWGTTPRQQTVSGTLSDIAERVRATGIKPPAVTIVGEVAGLRERLRWFDRRPLSGRRIVITRASEQAPELVERLEEQGAAVTVLSSIRIVPPDEYEQLDEAITQLGSFDWVVFTSVNGVRAFASRLWHQGRDWRALHRARVAAIGPATARELERMSLRPDLVPSRYVAEGILDEIGNVAGQRILLPRTDIARPTLAEQLRVRGADVREVVAYRTVTELPDVELLRKALVDERPDAIAFTSSSTVRGLVEGLIASQLGEPRAVLRDIALACIGPITAETVRGYGLVPTVSAEEYTMDGLTEALMRHLARNEHQSEGVAAQ